MLGAAIARGPRASELARLPPPSSGVRTRRDAPCPLTGLGLGERGVRAVSPLQPSRANIYRPRAAGQPLVLAVRVQRRRVGKLRSVHGARVAHLALGQPGEPGRRAACVGGSSVLSAGRTGGGVRGGLEPPYLFRAYARDVRVRLGVGWGLGGVVGMGVGGGQTRRQCYSESNRGFPFSELKWEPPLKNEFEMYVQWTYIRFQSYKNRSDQVSVASFRLVLPGTCTTPRPRS